jgi:hypothetical protein
MSGTIIPDHTVDWSQKVFEDEDHFISGLVDLNLDQEFVEGALEEYRSAIAIRRKALQSKMFEGSRRYYGPDGAADAWAERVRRAYDRAGEKFRAFLGMQEFVVENKMTKLVDIPLFSLRSPSVIGSKVTYSESLSKQCEATWGVTILGSGMGATTVFKVEHSASFESANGDNKLIFVPVRLLVSQVAVYRRGTLLGRGLRCEMQKTDRPHPFNKGIMTMPLDAVAAQRPRPNTEGQLFPLGGDRSSTSATYRQEWEESTDVETSIGIEAFNLKVKTKASIAQNQKVALSYQLPGGHNYRVKPLADVHGIWWEVDNSPVSN